MTAITLRAIGATDLPAIFEQMRDPASVAMAAVKPRERDAFDAHWARVLADPHALARVILLDGRVAGHVSSWRDAASGRVMVGYWLARDAWGRGVATRALAEFLRAEARRPLHATVASHNPASVRVLEKNGFTRMGESVARDGVGIVEFELRGP